MRPEGEGESGDAMMLTEEHTTNRGADERLTRRRLTVGAEIQTGGVYFRVWAPRRTRVEVIFEETPHLHVPLCNESHGYFSGIVTDIAAGALYRFHLDGGGAYPDPASRFQPQGPHGPSEVIDPTSFRWTDDRWKGVEPEGQILYEMHVGTFTREGTWEAAARELPELARLGITCIEVMPVAEFAGNFGWGYDGVNLFAPTRLYGHPDDFRRFVDRAHALKLGVILDVVYNHFGPDGNYLKEFSSDYFTDRHKTDWGEAINYDGPNSQPVRDFFLANARHWIEEYHLDGFRFDATQNVYDDSNDHVLAAIARTARRAAGHRKVYLICENEPQETRIVRPPDQRGLGMDGLWNDDFHHSAAVVLTGRREAYYSDFGGRPQEFISAAKWGYLFQGQQSKWQNKPRGTPALDLPPSSFVHFIENHDQVSNSAHGLRTHQLSGPALYRAMSALLLLCPQTPLIFQGQEFAASSPFLYFADHAGELGRLVSKGRKEFLCQFPSIATGQIHPQLPDPADPRTFEQCKLDLTERQRHAEAYALYHDLLKLRRDDPTFRGRRHGRAEGAVLGDHAFLLRFFGPDADDRMLVVNFGTDLNLSPGTEPLLAPPLAMRWDVLWSSEDPKYGGDGTCPPESETGWLLPGRCAILLRPARPR